MTTATPDLMLSVQEPVEPRQTRIRALFQHLGGGMGTATFAHTCIDQGLYTDNDLKRFQLRAVQSEIRAALKATDAAGLPFAGITTEQDEDGAPVWQQRVLWGFEDYVLNIRQVFAQRDECHASGVKLIEECRRRFGKGPDATPVEERKN